MSVRDGKLDAQHLLDTDRKAINILAVVNFSLTVVTVFVFQVFGLSWATVPGGCDLLIALALAYGKGQRDRTVEHLSRSQLRT